MKANLSKSEVETSPTVIRAHELRPGMVVRFHDRTQRVEQYPIRCRTEGWVWVKFAGEKWATMIARNHLCWVVSK